MQTVLIWDDEGPPPEERGSLTFLWSSYSAAGDDVSIPAVVEQRAGELRARFLGWIFDLGECEIAGRPVVEHLELRPGFSYWWMTILSHSPNYYEASFVTDVIKCLALEGLMPSDVGRVRLHTRNTSLREVMRQYCRVHGVECHAPDVQPATRAVDGMPARLGRLRRLAHWTSAAWGALRHRATALQRHPRRPAICIFDMLVHLRREALDRGVFRSQYWTSLSAALAGGGGSTTWVHTFFRHADVESVPHARDLVERFNRNAAPGERHVLLDRLTIPVMLSAAAAYMRLAIARVRLRGIGRRFSLPGSSFDFWPMFERVWHASLTGRAAVRNCLTLAWYEDLLSKLPHQDTGLYIKENQPWEMALLQAWRAAGHGRLIGVPHATVRFWDLRYFYDHRSYGPRGVHTVPIPDEVAANGPVTRDAYIAGGFPTAQVREVEALRFLHAASETPAITAGDNGAPLRVLVCGDNTDVSNRRMLEIISAAAAHASIPATFIFKPHKSAPVDADWLSSRGIDVRDGELSALLRDCDLVLTGSLTSAAVDAYCVGKRVASLLDGRALNGSPLRGMAHARYFATARELGVILTSVHADRCTPVASEEPYFWLDAALPRWRRLLNLQPA